MLKCSKCGLFKAYNEFDRQKTKKRGYHSWCKSCRREFKKPYTERERQRNALYYQKIKNIKKNMVCNGDCFNCIYDDCIDDTLLENDLKIDRLLLL